MNICFFHGLESDGPGRKGKHLQSLGWTLFAPHINYRDSRSVRAAWEEATSQEREAFIGSSMGGWMSALLASQTGTPAWMVNPALTGRSIDVHFPAPLGPHRPHVHVLFGRNDEVIDPQQSVRWLEQFGFSFTATWADESHRVSKPAFSNWIQTIQDQM